MRDPDFDALSRKLLKRGISPRHAHRAVNELRDHYDDLIDAAVDDGANSKMARRHAARRPMRTPEKMAVRHATSG